MSCAQRSWHNLTVVKQKNIRNSGAIVEDVPLGTFDHHQHGKGAGMFPSGSLSDPVDYRLWRFLLASLPLVFTSYAGTGL